MGRGVTAKSTDAYMLYHQKSLAQVKVGSFFLAASQIFSPVTRWFDCFQSATSATSRKYQPLATQPCSRGRVPVVNVDCTEQVTAGRMGTSGREESFARWGACARSSPVSPTTSRTSVRCMLTLDDRGLAAAEDGVALPEAALVDLDGVAELGGVHLAGLAEEGDGVPPEDGGDRLLRHALLAHEGGGLGDL